MEVHEALKKHFPVSSSSFESLSFESLLLTKPCRIFRFVNTYFGAHVDQQVYSAANSAFQELFPSSPATMKSFKINLPFLVLSSIAKTVRTK